ncbi:MAG: N-formylglutamate amidohydrolase [Roseovarius sp.]|nr:N-formylglutamate amidohydrolase [Roseovarius sp.]
MESDFHYKSAFGGNDCSTAAYDLVEPVNCSSSVVFASPHSGREYPESLMARTRLDKKTVRSSEDAYVDELFSCAPEFGSPVLIARTPRAYVDFNRAPNELDPALIEGAPDPVWNSRISSGLGVIPRVVANGQSIYSGRLPLSEAVTRLEKCWIPYHQKLEFLLNRAHWAFGESILIDCHSMPREAMDGVVSGNGGVRPEIVLGDRYGASAHEMIVDGVEAAFADAGFKVVRNKPFAGAYIAQRYGRPACGRHAVQIEIDRSLYMDERRFRKNASFHAFRALIKGVTAEIAAMGHSGRIPVAAE